MNKYNINNFWSKVEKTDTCWNWNGCTNGVFYGLISVNNKNILVHRFSYELHKGKIPDGLQIDHLCRNKLCVNPEHLEAVTQYENLKRGNTWLHHKSKTHCKNGHEYNEENTYKPIPNHRICIICRRERERKNYKLKY